MTDKNLTNKETIKALECCANCEDCFYGITSCPLGEEVECRFLLAQNALDLITRQQAEIERLEKENTAFGEIIKKQDDEISALRKDLLKRENLEESYSKSVKQFDKRLEKTVKLERAETVKEFADEFERRCVKGGIYPAFVKTQLKNVINEMVGENK